MVRHEARWLPGIGKALRPASDSNAVQRLLRCRATRALGRSEVFVLVFLFKKKSLVFIFWRLCCISEVAPPTE